MNRAKYWAGISIFLLLALTFVPRQAVAQTVNPTLDDLFAGKARFESLNESEAVNLDFNGSVQAVFDQKLAFFQKSDEPNVLYAATRGYLGKDQFNNNQFNIFLMRSVDGVNFTLITNPAQVNGAIFSFPVGEDWTVYDPHIAVDTSGLQPKYTMTMECAKAVSGSYAPPKGFGASVCISTSETPWDPRSWSPPQLVIENQGFKSASTGVSLVDNGNVYLSWTVVDDGNVGPNNAIPDEGFESTSTWATKLNDMSSFWEVDLSDVLARYEGYSTTRGRLLLGAEQNTHCTSTWDCNNIDVQDWQHIGSHYYAIYNGANYFRCQRPAAESGASNQWAIGIRRSDTPLGSYAASTGPLISAERDDLCGINYPVLKEIDGETFLYYSYYPGIGPQRSVIARSRLIWDTAGAGATTAIAASTPATPQFPLDFKPGELTIRPGTSIQLGGAFLKMQTDGNLVMYAGTPASPGGDLWDAGTPGQKCSPPESCVATFQTDGNFVLYDQSGPYLDTGTVGQGQILRLGSSAPFVSVLNAVDYRPGQFALRGGSSIPLAGGFITLQTDGNLVMYAGAPGAPGAALWSAGTASQQCAPDTCFAIFQTDGNLVLYDQNTAYWNSGTAGQGRRLRLETSAPFVTVFNIADQEPYAWLPDYRPGQFVLSAGSSVPLGDVFLAMQTDGNLVVYAGTPSNPGKPLWDTGTAGRQCQPATCFVTFQTDGNLVLYDQNTAYWNSGTDKKGQRLRLESLAPFVSVLDGKGKSIWRSDYRPGGFLLPAGDSISLSGKFLELQTDGNLVVYAGKPAAPGAALWDAGIPARQCSSDTCFAVFQTDGNLVLYDQNTPYWNTETQGKGRWLRLGTSVPYLSILNNQGSSIWSSDYRPGSLTLQTGDSVPLEDGFLTLQTDGNLVMYAGKPAAPGAVLWNAGANNGQQCSPDTCFAIFQTDGNLVLYKQNTPYWNTGTQGKGHWLRLETSAPFVSILNSSGKTVWP